MIACLIAWGELDDLPRYFDDALAARPDTILGQFIGQFRVVCEGKGWRAVSVPRNFLETLQARVGLLQQMQMNRVL